MSIPKRLLRAKNISVLLLQMTIISLNNEPQLVSFELCYVSCHGFEVSYQFSQFQVFFQVSNHFIKSKKLPYVVQLHKGFDMFGSIATSNDENGALFYSIHLNKLAQIQKVSSLASTSKVFTFIFFLLSILLVFIKEKWEPYQCP